MHYFCILHFKLKLSVWINLVSIVHISYIPWYLLVSLFAVLVFRLFMFSNPPSPTLSQLHIHELTAKKTCHKPWPQLLSWFDPKCIQYTHHLFNFDFSMHRSIISNSYLSRTSLPLYFLIMLHDPAWLHANWQDWQLSHEFSISMLLRQMKYVSHLGTQTVWRCRNQDWKWFSEWNERTNTKNNK